MKLSEVPEFAHARIEMGKSSFGIASSPVVVGVEMSFVLCLFCSVLRVPAVVIVRVCKCDFNR